MFSFEGWQKPQSLSSKDQGISQRYHLKLESAKRTPCIINIWAGFGGISRSFTVRHVQRGHDRKVEMCFLASWKDDTEEWGINSKVAFKHSAMKVCLNTSWFSGRRQYCAPVLQEEAGLNEQDALMRGKKNPVSHWQIQYGPFTLSKNQTCICSLM